MSDTDTTDQHPEKAIVEPTHKISDKKPKSGKRKVKEPVYSVVLESDQSDLVSVPVAVDSSADQSPEKGAIYSIQLRTNQREFFRLSQLLLQEANKVERKEGTPKHTNYKGKNWDPNYKPTTRSSTTSSQKERHSNTEDRKPKLHDELGKRLREISEEPAPSDIRSTELPHIL